MQLSQSDIIETMDFIVDEILIPHFLELGLNATGEWINALNTRADGDVGIINGRQYTEQLVYGRRPNSDTSHDAIRRWAYGMANYNPEFKAWLNVRGLSDYGFQVAYKIAREGTEIYKEGGTNLLEILETPSAQRKIEVYLEGKFNVLVTNYLQREIEKAWK